MNKNKIAIYTAVFGDGYDKIKEPSKKIKGCDFICFTDDASVHSDVFDVRLENRYFSDPTLDARMRKILTHKFLPEYEYVVWIDGSVVIRTEDIEYLIDKYLKKHDVAIHQHSLRNCIYDEMLECFYRAKDDPADMLKQIISYIKEGYPPNNGLAETPIVFRRNLAENTKKINEDWWREIEKHSRRDQLSFDYVIWKNNLDYYRINANARDNENFFVAHHEGQRENHEINMLKQKITTMEKSKFWKIRGRYLQLQNFFKK
ncbi:MAG: glycosyltransferase domain-containing protein [Candidatus Moraniibacteriota bacterium]|jgi:alkaline ceramidase TOD1/glycosyltransferase MUCI70-like protein